MKTPSTADVRSATKAAVLTLCLAFGTLAAGSDEDQAKPDLIAAVAEQDADGVAALLASGASANETNDEGFAVLHLAAAGDSTAILSQLIAAGADVNAAAEGTSITPLHVAASRSESAVATLLLDAGASVAAVTAQGATPLHLAVQQGHAATARVLIEAGASANAEYPQGGVTLLHHAASQGARDLAAVLIEGGADMEATDAAGHTPLHHVAARVYEDGEQGVAKLLIDAGANVNARDGRGLTALHMAVGSNRHELATALLDAGANIDAAASASAAGATPLHIAAAGGWLDCVELLLRRGAVVDPPAVAGIGSPLLVAVENDREYAAAALVEHGADANAKNEDGETAAAIAERKGMTEVLVYLREAAETSPPARELDPEVLERLLARAIERDAADAVLQLLDGVDAENFHLRPLHEAARRDSPRVAEALLGIGFHANIGTTRPLHIAAHHESTEVAALLIERGAEVDARDDDGWTPLHYALLVRGGIVGVEKRWSPRMANLLLEHGADVNAATEAMGWTPLHLAAHLSGSSVWQDSDEPSGWKEAEFGDGADVSELVQTLIDRGADVNARTRLGGWTPARVAKKSDGRRQEGLDPGNPSQAVLAALQAAGGEDHGCRDAPTVPGYSGGRLGSSREREQRRADAAPGCEYDLPLNAPYAITGGAWEEAGSFTAPGADERLLFQDAGLQFYGDRWFHLASLRHRDGTVRPVVGFDHYVEYEGLCFDGDTETHAAVFTLTYDGTCCPWSDTAYYHYDAEIGTLAEVFVGSLGQPTGKEEACRWRETMQGLDIYENALDALRVGELSGLEDDGEPRLAPSRVVPTEVVESQLETLGGLDVASVWRPDVETPRWRVAVAEVGMRQTGSVDVCEGVLLVWDGERQEWRSIYDCADLYDIQIHADTLFAELYSNEPYCGPPRLAHSCYLELDLTTREARLWDYRWRDHWRDRRERLSR